MSHEVLGEKGCFHSILIHTFIQHNFGLTLLLRQTTTIRIGRTKYAFDLSVVFCQDCEARISYQHRYNMKTITPT